jgi:hypothetical protein
MMALSSSRARVRWAMVLGLTAASTLFATTALAAGGTTGKGETGEKGGKGPAATSNNPEDEVDPNEIDRKRKSNVGATNPELVEVEKPWEVGASAEFHRLVRQSDIGGGYKNLAVYSAFVRYAVTPHDRFVVQEILTEKFVADEGETGLRLGDVNFTYTHSIPLPKDFGLAITGSVSTPTSLAAQKESLIVAPGLAINGSKGIGLLTLSARASGSALIMHYREAEGGAANPKFTLSFALSADMQMPFHEPLSFGVSASTGYTWFYNVQFAPSATQDFYGTVQDQNFANQPVLQAYGGEVYARYTFPDVSGFKMDFSLAYGMLGGGFTSVLHDGVEHTYLFVRESAALSGVFGVRY